MVVSRPTEWPSNSVPLTLAPVRYDCDCWSMKTVSYELFGWRGIRESVYLMVGRATPGETLAWTASTMSVATSLSLTTGRSVKLTASLPVASSMTFPVPGLAYETLTPVWLWASRSERVRTTAASDHATGSVLARATVSSLPPRGVALTVKAEAGGTSGWSGSVKVSVSVLPSMATVAAARPGATMSGESLATANPVRPRASLPRLSLTGLVPGVYASLMLESPVAKADASVSVMTLPFMDGVPLRAWSVLPAFLVTVKSETTGTESVSRASL